MSEKNKDEKQKELDCQEKQNPDRRKQRFPEGTEERRGKSLLQNKGREKETKNE